MSSRQGQRDQLRHWLPSQGVDPAPLAELNSECLGLLALRAGGEGDPCGLPPLITELHELWADLPAQAVRRLAAAPFSLFDADFGGSGRGLELRATGVHDLPEPSVPVFFDSSAGRSITRRMLVYGWHLARSRPRAACLVFGATLPAVETLAACSLAALDTVAERKGDGLRPRWPHQIYFWRELLLAASAGTDGRLHELLLGGVQRLAAESLAAQSFVSS